MIGDPEVATPPILSFLGVVAGIFITNEAAAPMRSVPEATAVAGRGLEGDRYFDRRGTYSQTPGTGREITLIEMEALDAARDDYELDLAPSDARRNIATLGVALNHLVGQDFLLGDVRLRGMRLCEPCAHLSKLAHRPLVKPLRHRGGLRAEIVDGGIIRVGDPIRPFEPR
jgi:MOSC domain-containing protein YiiM